MILRIHQLGDADVRHAVRRILIALAPLVLDDVALAVHELRRHDIEEISHAVRFEVQRKIEGVGRDRFVIVRPIRRRRSVVVAPGGFEQVVELAFLDVAGAFEHKMLEQVREAGATRFLTRRSDVVPDIDGDGGHAVVFVQDHREPVLELEHREGHGEFRCRGRLLRRRRRDRQTDGHERREQHSSHRHNTSHSEPARSGPPETSEVLV
jgi:hypothetical protein